MRYDLFDSVNSLFEVFGGAFAWQNCRRLYYDKVVMGVDWRVTAFWVLWGLWNMIYYPHLHQWASFTGGLLIVLANGFWVYLVWRYKRL